jgi:predicted transcriptional regulator
MMYIITEAEMAGLTATQIRRTEEERKKLQDVCSFVADNMPIQFSDDQHAPWGCILTNKKVWYCDKCPVETICPHDNKSWSK